MFKYISEIIGQISLKQRLIALIVVLISIIAISLGPSFIDTITMDKDDYTEKIEKQKVNITNLQVQVNTLRIQLTAINDSLFIAKSECNNRLLNIEQDYINQIVTRERYILTKITQLETLIEESEVTVSTSYAYIVSDTTEIDGEVMMAAPEERSYNESSEVLDDIAVLKSELKYNIREKKKKIVN